MILFSLFKASGWSLSGSKIQTAYAACLQELSQVRRRVLLLEIERIEHDPMPQQEQWAADHGFTRSQYAVQLHRARNQLYDCMRQRLGDNWPS